MMIETPDSVCEVAPAKLNLALHVTGQREDGFHLLDMLVVFTEFGDTIECALSDQDVFEVIGPMAAGVPLDTNNIVIKTRDYIRALYAGYDCPSVSITLTKRLPSASGIGGGSADAGATLRALLKLWDLPIESIELEKLAQHIGADVPMCYLSQPLIAHGIGEEIKTITASFPEMYLVLVNCREEISTPAIFKRLENKDNPALPNLPNSPSLNAMTVFLSATRNDLVAPAMEICGDVEVSFNALDQHGALFSRMSGSGATCFGIFETDQKARHAAELIQKQHADWWVIATKTTSLKGT